MTNDGRCGSGVSARTDGTSTTTRSPRDTTSTHIIRTNAQKAAASATTEPRMS
jgi:hypothetical protein